MGARPQQLVARALGWVRWGAMVPFLSGAAIITKRVLQAPPGASVMTSPWGEAIFTGALFGTLMFVNVWAVIWPKQQIVIASAVAAAGGGQANPAAAAAGRRAVLASRTHVVFSVPMLFFMGAATHLPPSPVTHPHSYWGGRLVVAGFGASKER